MDVKATLYQLVGMPTGSVKVTTQETNVNSVFEEKTNSIPFKLQNGDDAIIDVWNGNDKPANTNVSFLSQRAIGDLADIRSRLDKVDKMILDFPNSLELIQAKKRRGEDLYQGGEQAFAYSSSSKPEFEDLLKQRQFLMKTQRLLIAEITKQAVKKATSSESLSVMSIKVNNKELMKWQLSEGYYIESTYKEPDLLKSLKH